MENKKQRLEGLYDNTTYLNFVADDGREEVEFLQKLIKEAEEKRANIVNTLEEKEDSEIEDSKVEELEKNYERLEVLNEFLGKVYSLINDQKTSDLIEQASEKGLT